MTSLSKRLYLPCTVKVKKLATEFYSQINTHQQVDKDVRISLSDSLCFLNSWKADQHMIIG